MVEKSHITKRAIPEDDGAMVQAIEEVLESSMHAFGYSALQSPLNGAAQLIDHVADTKCVAAVQMIEAPKEADFGSAEWHAQQVGGALGMAADYYLLSKVLFFRPARALAGTAETVSLSGGRAIAKAAIGGAVYDGIFRPVQPGEGDFLAARLSHAGTGAITFATLTGAGLTLKSLGRGAAEGSRIRSLLSNEAAVGAASGIPAGMVNAQLTSLFAGKGPAGPEEMVKAAYGFMVAGGALGASHYLTAGRSFGGIQEAPAATLAKAVPTGEIGNLRAPEAYVPWQVPMISPPARNQADIAGMRFDPNPQPAGLRVSDTNNHNPVPNRQAETTPVQETPKGEQITRRADGIEIKQLPDGTKITSLPDGTIMTESLNGARTTRYPDGKQIMEIADGTKIFIEPNGRRFIMMPDGSKVHEGPGSPRVTRRPDDTRVEEFPNGDVFTTHPNGTMVRKFANGDTVTNFPDGTEISQWANGTKITLLPDYTEITEYPNGQRSSRRLDPNLSLSNEPAPSEVRWWSE